MGKFTDVVQTRVEINGKEALNALGHLESHAHDLKNEMKTLKKETSLYERTLLKMNAYELKIKGFEKLKQETEEAKEEAEKLFKEYEKGSKILAQNASFLDVEELQEEEKRLQELKTQAEQLKKVYQKNQAVLSKTRLPTQAYENAKNKIDALKNSADKYYKASDSLEDLNQKIDKHRHSLGLAGMTAKQLRTEYREIKRQLDQMTEGTEQYAKLSKRFREINNALKTQQKNLKDTRNAWQKMKDSASGFLSTAGGIIGGELILGAFQGVQEKITMAIDGAVKLSDQLTDIQKKSGLSSQKVKELNSELSKIKTRTSSSDLREMAIVGGSLGFGKTKDELLSFVKTMDKVVVALGDEFTGGATEASRSLGGLQKLFKETQALDLGEGIERIASAINALGNAGSARAPEVSEFTKRLGALGDLKPTIEETLGLGAALIELGLNPDTAAGGVTAIMLQAGKETKAFSKQIGITEKKFKNLINTDPNKMFLRLAESFKGLSNEQVIKALNRMKVGSQEAIKVMGLLASKTEFVVEKQQLATTEFAKNSSLQNEFNLKMSNFAAKMDLAKKKINAFEAGITKALLPAITKGVEIFILFLGVLQSLPKFLKENKGYIYLLATTLAAYNAQLILSKTNQSLLFAIQKLGIAQQKIKLILDKEQNIQSLISQRNKITETALEIRSNAVKMISVARTTAITAAQWAWNAALSANPIGIVILAIAALVAGLIYAYQNFDSVKKIVDEFNGSLGALISGTWNTFLEALKNAWKFLSHFTQAFWALINLDIEGFTKHTKKALSHLFQFWTNWIDNLKNYLIQNFELAFDINQYYQRIKSGLKNVTRLFRSKMASWFSTKEIEKQVAEIQGFFKSLRLSEIFENDSSAIKKILLSLKNWVTNKFSGVWDLIEKRWGASIKNAQKSLSVYGAKIKSIFSPVADIFLVILGYAKQFINKLNEISKFTARIKSIKDAFMEGFNRPTTSQKKSSKGQKKATRSIFAPEPESPFSSFGTSSESSEWQLNVNQSSSKNVSNSSESVSKKDDDVITQNQLRAKNLASSSKKDDYKKAVDDFQNFKEQIQNIEKEAYEKSLDNEAKELAQIDKKYNTLFVKASEHEAKMKKLNQPKLFKEAQNQGLAIARQYENEKLAIQEKYAKKLAEERQAFHLARDLEQMTSHQKELYELDKHYEQLIEKAQNLGLDTAQIEQEWNKKYAEIDKKYAQEELERINENAKKLLEAEKTKKEALNKAEKAKAELNVVGASTELGSIDARIKQLDVLKNIELQNTELLEEEKALIEEKYRQQKIQLEKDKFSTIIEGFKTAESLGESFGQLIFQKEINRSEAAKTKRLQDLDDEYAQGTMSKEKYEQAKSGIEKQAEKEQAKIKTKQAKAEKKWLLAKAIMNTSAAVAKALPNLLLSAAAALAGGIQIAKIKTESIPKFEKGGFIPKGSSHQEGGISLFDNKNGQHLGEMEGGEPILSKATYANNKPLIDKLIYNSLYKNGAAVVPNEEAVENSVYFSRVSKFEKGGFVPEKISSSNAEKNELSDPKFHPEIMKLIEDVSEIKSILKSNSKSVLKNEKTPSISKEDFLLWLSEEMGYLEEWQENSSL